MTTHGGMKRKFSSLTQNTAMDKNLRKTLEREDNDYFETNSDYKVVSQAAPHKAVIKENYFDEEIKLENIDPP